MLVVLASPLAGCSPLYLFQAAAGQLEMLRLKRPVAEVIADAATPPELRGRLAVAEDVLRFAHQTLLLPDNGSYRHYVDLHRRYAVWNVFAAPEFSLELRQWCFPVAGCVGYRGYFAEERAREYAAQLGNDGSDVFVAGVAAYSTLGFFADPLLNTLMDLPDAQLAGLIFHELAHQLLYVRGDTTFNESLATFLEQEGVIRWLSARGDTTELCDYRTALARQALLRGLLDDSRSRLAAIFAAPGNTAEKRAAKAAEFTRLGLAYRDLRSTWQGPPDFDAWFAAPLNNAALGALAAYDEFVPAFGELLKRQAGMLLAFQAGARELARLPEPARRKALEDMRPAAVVNPPPAAEDCRAGSG